MAGPKHDPQILLMRGETRRLDGKVIAAAALVCCLAVAAVFVAFILPGQVRTQDRPSTAPPGVTNGSTAPTTAAVPQETPAVNSDAVDDQRTAVLRKLAKLEGEGVRTWGMEVHAGASLELAEAALAEGNDAVLARDFSAAVPLFREAGAQLDSLDATRPDRLATAKELGAAALARHDAAAALKQFEMAAALAPGDPQAGEGLERARKLPDALARLRAGDAALAVGDLQKAREAYRQALGIDANLQAAESKVRQVEAQLATLEYQKAVSDVVARLREGNPQAAEAALKRAERLRPHAPEIAELKAQHGAAARLSALQDLQGRAEALERQEKWQEAASLYQQAIKVDPTTAFASHGLNRSRQQAALHDSIDTYLANPDRLRSAEPRGHAQAMLRMAGAADGGPVLADKARRLEALLAAAQTPVVVRLRSDNATDVEVYRFGIVGAFGERQISLAPGRYTAVGRRSGFRDVRVQFDVAPGAAPLEVVVQCTEKIR